MQRVTGAARMPRPATRFDLALLLKHVSAVPAAAAAADTTTCTLSLYSNVLSVCRSFCSAVELSTRHVSVDQ